MSSIDRKAFVEEAEKALKHSLVEKVIDELCKNLGAPRGGIVEFGIRKVARYAAVVARAQALGIDPDELRMTPDEAESAGRRFAEWAAERGLPVIFIARSAGLSGYVFPPEAEEEEASD